MAMKTNLVGMFLVLDTADHEYYRTGQIVAAVGNCYLIQFDKLDADQPSPSMELVTLEELSGRCQNCEPEARQLVQDPRRHGAVDRLAQ